MKCFPEGTMAELINGPIYMSPASTNKYQWLLIAMVRTIADFRETHALGKILIVPSDVENNEENISQPLDEVQYPGVPDLTIEFLSPSNNKDDLLTKKELYEKFGVKEYWIIDPSTKEAIVYPLENNLYTLAGKNTAALFSPMFNHSFSF